MAELEERPEPGLIISSGRHRIMLRGSFADRGELILDGEPVTLEPGDYWLVPTGATHLQDLREVHSSKSDSAARVVAGMVTSILLDHFGSADLGVHPFSPWQVVSGVLMFGGVALAVSFLCSHSFYSLVPSPEIVREIVHMADVLADCLLNAQVTGRPVKQSDNLGHLEASLLLLERGQETPPLVVQVVRRLDET